MKKTLLIIAIVLCIFQMIVLAVDIDIGTPAILRVSNIPPNYTYINRGNPANATGKITSVELYVLDNDLENCEVATFYLVSGTNFSTRDSEYIGTVTANSHQQFDVNLDVVTGDYIGLFYNPGNLYMDHEGGVAYWYKAGDNIPCTDATFTYTGNITRILSFYGTGTTVVGWPHKWNTKTISKWNTKEFTKWNDLE